MGDRRGRRSAHSSSLDHSLLIAGICSLALGGIQLALALPSAPDEAWLYLLFVFVFWLFVGAGLIAWSRRPSNSIGEILFFAGLAIYAVGLGGAGIPVFTQIGVVLATAILAVIVHLLHAFPSGRVKGTFARSIVIAGYVVALVLQMPLYLFDPASPLSIADQPGLLLVGVWFQRAAGFAVLVCTAVVLYRRYRVARAPHRRILAPVFVYGILTVLFIPVPAAVLRPWFGVSGEASVALQLAVFCGIPIIFSLGILKGGFAKTGELDELGAWLGDAGGEKPALATEVARALGDPSVQIVFWVPDQEEWVDQFGAPSRLPGPEEDRTSVEIRLADRLVGAITYDSELIADPELVRAAGHVVAIAADRERLLAELLATRDALLRSRVRLLEAADRERRKIAQNLHDGLQVRLVLLALDAQRLANEEELDSPVRRRATSLRQGIDDAAAELRRLVYEVLPSVLIERGLSVAIEDVVDRMPVPTRLQMSLPDDHVDEAIESTAYFIVAEGLVNGLKHSGATSFEVRIEEREDGLLVEVQDDGTGGASLEAGRGLRGIADRTDVVGGTFDIQSPADGGTRLTALLPRLSRIDR